MLVDAHQQPVDFTQGEYGLLLALAQNSRRVLICEQLLDLIHGETTEVFDRTIDVLIMRLCRKIEINPRKSDTTVSQLLVELELKDLKTGIHSAPGFSLFGH
ncbi:TPA: winged helix-turn-helix transcriptional regulator [Escherichia coli]|nr:hypothetical protein AOY77_03205 [Escherichia coli]HCZ5412429.1 winged helix-turn-helix transcriptional regulator [Escherichia coli]HEI2860217.1 winged helix-turn-helix transcriptional regulator [Escherichia coli]